MEQFGVSVLRFGAKGDGVTDDYAAIQRALDSGESVLWIPQGVYAISATLRISSNTTLYADRGAKLIMQGGAPRTRRDFLITNADWEQGNEHIKICGGIWDGNNQAPEVRRSKNRYDPTVYTGVLMNFIGVRDLTLTDMVLANANAFYLRLGRVTDFCVARIDLYSDHATANQDGIHIGGAVRNGTVSDIRALSVGQTNDDLIAINADDVLHADCCFDMVNDAIENIEFKNIYAENCHTVIRLLSIASPIRNLHFENIYGGFRCYAINADAARYCNTPLFCEQDYPDGVGVMEHLTFDHFVCFPVSSIPTDFEGTGISAYCAIVWETKVHDLSISDFQYLCDATRGVDALVARYLPNTRVVADGKTHVLSTKADTLTLPTFTELQIN